MTKPSEIVNVHSMVDDAIALDRRTFVKGAGLAVLTVQFLPLTAHAAGNSPGDGNEAAGNLIIRSGPGLMSHVHDLLIPYAVLKTPPAQGVEVTSTKAFFHTHTLTLTREQLMSINRGGTVTEKASSHVFVIALASRQDHIQPGSGNQSRS